MLTALTVNFIAVLLAALSRRGNTVFMTLSQLLMSLVYGVRYDYGNDYWHYYAIFLKSSNGIDPDVIEVGWGLINFICQPIGFFGMVFLITCFEYHVVYKFIKQYVSREYWWIAVYIFTFTFNFQLLGCSMMRQFLVMVLFFYSIRYIINHNLLKFALLSLVAVSIHKTAIVFIPFYLLGYTHPNPRSKTFILSCSALFLVLMAVSAKYIEYFQIAAVIFDDDKFDRYLMGDEGSYSFTIIFDFLWLVLLMKFCPDDKTKKMVCVISLLSYALLPFSFVVILLLRLMLYFSIFFIFSIPNMLSGIKTPLIRYGVFAIYVLLLMKRSLTTMTGETYGEYYEKFLTIFSSSSWL